MTSIPVADSNATGTTTQSSHHNAQSIAPSASGTAAVPKDQHTASKFLAWTGVALTLGAFIVAIYYGALTLKLSAWAARKDFREFCLSDTYSADTTSCEAALASPLPPPPLVARAFNTTLISVVVKRHNRLESFATLWASGLFLGIWCLVLFSIRQYGCLATFRLMFGTFDDYPLAAESFEAQYRTRYSLLRALPVLGIAFLAIGLSMWTSLSAN